MEIEIKKREGTDRISFKLLWLKTQFDRLRKIYTKDEVSNEELKNLLIKKYDERVDPMGRLFNPTNNQNEQMSLEQYLNYFLNSGNIITGYNVLIKNQDTAKSAAIDALTFILNVRTQYKNEMKKYPEGSAKHSHFDLLQKTEKILANAYYGIQSLPISAVYNYAIQNSITLSGQDFISCAIYLVEQFLGDNEHFRDIDDLINFISSVCHDLPSADILKTVLPISKDVLKTRLHSILEKDVDDTVIDTLLNNLHPDEITAIYYKNNLLGILSCPYYKDKLSKIAEESNYIPDAELVNNLCALGEYTHISYDRFFKISTQKDRKISLLTDTDSTFVYLNGVIRPVQKIMNNYDGKFQFNMVNLLIDVIRVSMVNVLAVMTKNIGAPEKFRPIMNIKNEYVYKRLLTTKDKKNYAGWLLSHFGKLIPGDDANTHLDIKGLAIRKTVVAKTLRPMLQDWLAKNILLPDDISLLKIYVEFNKIGKIVRDSLDDGKTEFLIPCSISKYENYKLPERLPAVRGTIVWNALNPSNSIVPPEKVMLAKLVSKKENCQEMIDLRDTYPEVFQVIHDTVFTTKPGEIDISKNGFSIIAIPSDVDIIPNYIRPLINYDTMVSANMRSAIVILEALGFTTAKQLKSNVIEL
jgi:hypothetical protein